MVSSARLLFRRQFRDETQPSRIEDAASPELDQRLGKDKNPVLMADGWNQTRLAGPPGAG
jgi:hypothetical protein